MSKTLRNAFEKMDDAERELLNPADLDKINALCASSMKESAAIRAAARCGRFDVELDPIAVAAFLPKRQWTVVRGKPKRKTNAAQANKTDTNNRNDDDDDGDSGDKNNGEEEANQPLADTIIQDRYYGKSRRQPLGDTLLQEPVNAVYSSAQALLDGLVMQPYLHEVCQRLYKRQCTADKATPLANLMRDGNQQPASVDDLRTVISLGQLANKEPGATPCKPEAWALEYAVAHLNALQLMPGLLIGRLVMQQHLHRRYGGIEHPKPAPIRMSLLGLPGTGKSEVIKTVLQYAEALGEQEYTWVAAPAALAAKNIGGQTLHRLMGWSQVPKLAPKEKLQHLHNTYLGICDEVSMVSGKMLELIDKSLRNATNNGNTPFGGQSIILAGDFYQLPPVNTTALYKGAYNLSKNPSKRNQARTDNSATNGLGLFLTGFPDSCVLSESMRARADPDLWAIIENMCYGYNRHGGAEEGHRRKLQDQRKLHERLVFNETTGQPRIDMKQPPFNQAKAGFPSHEGKCQYNVRAAAAHATTLGEMQFVWRSIDVEANQRVVDVTVDWSDARSNMFNLPYGKSDCPIPGTATWFTGMHVMGGCNNYETGVINGETYTAVGIYLHNDEPEWDPTAKVVHLKYLPRALSMKRSDDEEELIIKPEALKHKFGDQHWKRKGFRLYPFYAATLHKVQGMTLDAFCIHPADDYMSSAALMVGVSRVRHLRDLALLSKVPLNKMCEPEHDIRAIYQMRMETQVETSRKLHVAADQGDALMQLMLHDWRMGEMQRQVLAAKNQAEATGKKSDALAAAATATGKTVRSLKSAVPAGAAVAARCRPLSLSEMTLDALWAAVAVPSFNAQGLALATELLKRDAANAVAQSAFALITADRVRTLSDCIEAALLMQQGMAGGPRVDPRVANNGPAGRTELRTPLHQLGSSIMDEYTSLIQRVRPNPNVILTTTEVFRGLDKCEHSEYPFTAPEYSNALAAALIAKRIFVQGQTRKIVLPGNVNNNHWICFEMDLERRSVSAKDSVQTRNVKQWTDRLCVLGAALVPGIWTSAPRDDNWPQQLNLLDCGVYTLTAARIAYCHGESVGDFYPPNRSTSDCTSTLRSHFTAELERDSLSLPQHPAAHVRAVQVQPGNAAGTLKVVLRRPPTTASTSDKTQSALPAIAPPDRRSRPPQQQPHSQNAPQMVPRTVAATAATAGAESVSKRQRTAPVIIDAAPISASVPRNPSANTPLQGRDANAQPRPRGKQPVVSSYAATLTAMATTITTATATTTTTMTMRTPTTTTTAATRSHYVPTEAEMVEFEDHAEEVGDGASSPSSDNEF